MNPQTEMQSETPKQKPLKRSDLLKLVSGPKNKGLENFGTVLALAGAVVAPLGVSMAAGDVSEKESAAAQRIVEGVAEGVYPSNEQTQEEASIALEDQTVTPDEIALFGTTSQEIALPSATTDALAEANDHAEKAEQSDDVSKQAAALSAAGGTSLASVTAANFINARRRRSR